MKVMTNVKAGVIIIQPEATPASKASAMMALAFDILHRYKGCQHCWANSEKENTMNIHLTLRLKTMGLIALLLLASAPLTAQSPAKTKADSFAAFWNEFKSAVAKDDKEAVAAMTKLPIYLANKERSKDGFLKLYPSLFTKKVKTCLVSAKPVKEVNQDSYSVFCGKSIYVFARVEGKYKFTDLGAND